MSEYGEFDDDFESENESRQDDPAGLRKQLKELKKKLDASEARNAEHEKKLSDYIVRDVLNERGLSDKRALRLMKADGIDAADAEAVDAWLGENGDLFGYKPPTADEDAEAADGFRQISDTEGRGTPSGSREEILAKIKAADSVDEMRTLQAELSALKM